MGDAIRVLVFLAVGLNALAARAEVAGRWNGFYEAPTGLGALELTFSHEGTEWKASCKFPELDGENIFPIRDLTLNDTNVSFSVAVESRWLRFSGKFGVDKIEGAYEMFREGKSTYVGEWGVKRAPPASAGTVSTTPRVNSTNSQRQLPWAERKRVAEFPSPTGPFLVGRTTYYWRDPTRRETLTTDPDAKRELMVTLWYPGKKENGLSPAIYFPNYRLIAGQSPTPLPASLKADAFEGAPLPGDVRRFPVVLFSHGLGENTSRYSAQLEELASHGYLVAAIDHTYDNQATVFPDGRVARWSNRWEWAFSSDGLNQQRFIQAQLRVMVGDVSFVVDQLQRLNDERSGMFRTKLDLGRLGFFGHSLGGAIAPLVCQTDSRFKVCLNQDGIPTGQVVILDPAKGKLERPFMFLASRDLVTEDTLQLMALTRTEYEEHERNRQRHAYHVLDTMPVESYVIFINDATHGSFTDNPTLAADSLPTYRKRARTLQVIRDYTRAFLDKYLAGKNPALVDIAPYPEATISRYGIKAAP
jgi:dienelactone hydrolase